MHIVLNHTVSVIENIPKHSLGLYSQQTFEACNRWQRIYFDRQSSKRGGNHNVDWEQQCIFRCIRPLFLRNNVPITQCQPPYFAKTFVNFKNPLFLLPQRHKKSVQNTRNILDFKGQYVYFNFHGPVYGGSVGVDGRGSGGSVGVDGGDSGGGTGSGGGDGGDGGGGDGDHGGGGCGSGHGH